MVKLGMRSLLVLGISLAACTDDDDHLFHADGGVDGGASKADASVGMDSSVSLDAALADTGAPPQPDGAAPDASVDTLALKVERGRYLVENVGACGDCHTPRNQDGSPNLALRLSGEDCFADAFPADTTMGCLSSRNLTNDETGLKNRSDAEIKDMFMKGVRPDGKFLSNVMPYYALGNMNDTDADAIVAFLRTVPAVNHMVQAAQFPFADVPAATPTWPDALIPQPRSDYADQASAKRGRYLAGQFGVCMECHTPRDEMEQPVFARAFEGGDSYTAASLHLPAGFPATIYSSNITPDATGIMQYTVADVVAALKQGVDQQKKPICPPMPSGPMQAFGGLTDADATDIGNYLLSLPPKVSTNPNTCTPPGAP